jgi:hypothetical protein
MAQTKRMQEAGNDTGQEGGRGGHQHWHWLVGERTVGGSNREGTREGKAMVAMVAIEQAQRR